MGWHDWYENQGLQQAARATSPLLTAANTAFSIWAPEKEYLALRLVVFGVSLVLFFFQLCPWIWPRIAALWGWALGRTRQEASPIPPQDLFQTGLAPEGLDLGLQPDALSRSEPLQLLDPGSPQQAR
jgi:hypothetical protein